jgi:hypothetical protein
MKANTSLYIEKKQEAKIRAIEKKMTLSKYINILINADLKTK